MARPADCPRRSYSLRPRNHYLGSEFIHPIDPNVEDYFAALIADSISSITLHAQVSTLPASAKGRLIGALEKPPRVLY
jgi:hypothetical protein